MNTQDIQLLYQEFILPTYTQVPLCLVKGKGSRVWDIQGKEYIDFFPGWAVSGLGHCHPEVVNAIKDQARKILHVPNNFLNVKQAFLAAELSKAAFPARAFFCNSGAEANEAAIKFARKYGAENGRFEIITMKKSFHGRTLAALTATGQEKVQTGYTPLPEGFRYADFNQLDSVKKLVTNKTVAVMLEPVQGEGGVHTATPEFMKGLRQLCNEKDMLLILDEVQTAMGRTGKLFAFQHYGIIPDIMTLAKSLGNGVPIGAMLASRTIQKEIFIPGSHGSTYGGNPLVCAAALAVLKTIHKKQLIHKAAHLGKYFGERLEVLKSRFSFIKEVRGMGLMRGLELTIPGADFVTEARAQGLLINCTQDKVLRLFPVLTISKHLLDEGLKILEGIFKDYAERSDLHK